MTVANEFVSLQVRQNLLSFTVLENHVSLEALCCPSPKGFCGRIKPYCPNALIICHELSFLLCLWYGGMWSWKTEKTANQIISDWANFLMESSLRRSCIAKGKCLASQLLWLIGTINILCKYKIRNRTSDGNKKYKKSPLCERANMLFTVNISGLSKQFSWDLDSLTAWLWQTQYGQTMLGVGLTPTWPGGRVPR